MKYEFLLYSQMNNPAEVLFVLKKEWEQTLEEIRTEPLPQAYQQYSEIGELKKSEVMPILEESSFALVNMKDRKWPTRAIFTIRTAGRGNAVPVGEEYIHVLSYLKSHTLIDICQKMLSRHNYAINIENL
jgi:hypothetical protein